MLPTQCSFCQHENTPGARFCAECGSPMHLKVCPNPDCGKVSDVAAAICETCGQPFPAPVVKAVAKDTPPAPQPEAEPPAAAKPTQRMAAWPLIAMAVVAGGIPLLWANRAQLPTPKTWQLDTPDTAKAGAAAPVPAPPTPIATVPAPVPAQVAPPPLSPSANDATSTPPRPDAAAATTRAKSPTEKDKISKKDSRKESQQACTEAAAALNLCTPKAR